MTESLSVSLGDEIRAHPVLFVDDNPEHAAIFEARFGETFTLFLASSPFQALEILARGEVAVMVTDYRMPGMNGIDLCEQVKLRWPRVLRAVVTGYPDRDMAVDAINRGEIHRMLTRPAKDHEELGLLMDLVARAHLERSVSTLEAAIVTRERDAHVALARGGILHDLAGFTGGLTLGCHALQEQLERASSLLPAHTLHGLREELDSISLCIDHLTDLHGQARQLSRASASGRDGHEMRELVETAIEMVRREPGVEAAIEVVCPEPHPVHVDRVDISRVLLNLLRNARQALRGVRDPRIQVEVRRVGLEVQVSVADNGPGVPPHRAERVFELSWSTREEEGGQGLGLYLSRQLAEANGGQLALRRAVLGGADFVLEVPSCTKAELGLLPEQPTPVMPMFGDQS